MIYQTPRLIVRRFEPGDLEGAYAILSDPEISRYEQWEFSDREQVRADLAEQAAVEPGTPGVWNEFAAVLKESGFCIGNMACKPGNPTEEQAEIGFHFARAYHGRGYGSEAVSGLIDWLFSRGTHRVWAVADTRNAASWKLMEKLGLRREAHFRENCRVQGEWADEYLYAVLASEWKAGRTAGT